MEAAYYGLPYCLVYKLAWPTFLFAKMVVNIELVGLVNILAGREVVREFIQSEAEPGNVGGVLTRFLTKPAEVEKLQGELAETVAKLGGPGAHKRAANAVNTWFG